MTCKNWMLAASLATFLGLSAAPLAGAAEDLKSAFKDLKGSCKDDISKFCNDIQPGGGRLAACLNSNATSLSSSCNDARQKASAMVSQAHMDFEKSCGSDVQKYCAQANGRMAIHDCLSEHMDSLSGSCKNLQAKINQRIDKGLG